MTNLLKLKDMIQEVIDKGATSVEQIHKAIAAMPLEALEKIEPLGPTAQTTRKIQENTIGSVYEIIRKVNKEVGALAEDLLKKVDAVRDESENY
jgi:hypothetical protein